MASLMNVQQALSKISRSTCLEGFPGNPSVETLTTYMIPNEWLTNIHEAQLLELLRRDLQQTPQKEGTNIEDVFFVTLLCDAYENRGHYLLDWHWKWLWEKGDTYANGTWKEAATITITGGNHWVAIVLDFENASVRYGDSMGGKLTEDMKTAIEWWTFTHSSQKFMHQSLPIARQRDVHSCGLMAWNALAAYLCESVTLVDPSNMAVERLQVLLPLIKVAADISGSNGYDEDDILSLKSESSDGYDEGDSSDELDSDGSIDRASIGADHDMKMLDGDKTCSLRCSDLSEQEARDNPPPTKTLSIRNALEIAAKDPTTTAKVEILKESY